MGLILRLGGVYETRGDSERPSRVVFTVNENLATLIRERFEIRFGNEVMAFFLLSRVHCSPRYQ